MISAVPGEAGCPGPAAFAQGARPWNYGGRAFRIGAIATTTGAAQCIPTAEPSETARPRRDGPGAGAVPCGYVYVDGSSVGDISEAAMTDRRILGEEGFISVFLVVDAVEGKVAVGPEFHARGFSEDDAVFDDVADRVRSALEDAMRDGGADRHQLQQITRRVVGRWVSGQHRRRPMIIPVVIEE